MYRLILILATLAMLNSCGTISRFDEDNEERLINRNIYPALQTDFSMLAGVGRGGMFSEIAMMASPLVILDIPISFIVDTVMLPYDIGMYAYNSHYLNYWNDIAENRNINKPISEYLQYFNKTGAVAVLGLSGKVNDQDVLNFYFDIATAADAEPDISRKIIARLVSKADANAEYSSLRLHTCNTISADLGNTKFSRGIHKIIEGHGYSEACIQSLAANGLDCSLLVRNKYVQGEYLRKCYHQNPSQLVSRLSINPSTPADVMNDMFNDECSKLTTQGHSLGKVNSSNSSMRVITNIARVTKDNDLIRRLYEIDNEDINSALIYNPSVPVKYKLSSDSFISNYVNSDSTTSDELIELIAEYPDNKNLIIAIASGRRVDIGVYNALMKYTPNNIRPRVYESIVFNRELISDDIPFKLASRPDVKELLKQDSFEHLSSITEIPIIELGDYGVLDFIVNHPEIYNKTALLKPWLLSGIWIAKEKTRNIKIEKNKKFGFFYTPTRKLSNDSAVLKRYIIPPKGSPEILVAELKKNSVNNLLHEVNTEYVYIYTLSEDWEMVSGDWIFNISHRGKVLLTITFHLYDDEE
jgi:uncharacterized protein YceK